MLERLGEREIQVEQAGDGAGSLVESWAGRDPDGRVTLMLWNGTLDQSKTAGHAPLNRTIRLRFNGLAGKYLLRHHRVDKHHSNIGTRFDRDTAWPSEQQWTELRARDQLDRIGADFEVDDDVEMVFSLPMPSISLIELIPRISQ
jgi:xylan 1,4-beta-xylosidase